MVAPGARFRDGTLLRSKIRRKPKKKDLRCKMSGLLVQMRMGTKQSEKRYSPQIGGVVVSHHNMVSPQVVSP